MRKPQNMSYAKFLILALRYYVAMYLFYDHPCIRQGRFRLSGGQSLLTRYHKAHKHQRIYIIANGPSLNEVDISIIQPNDIVIGCNGILRDNKWKHKIHYYFCEDQEQTYIRRKEIQKYKPKFSKFSALYNAPSLGNSSGIEYFYAPARNVFDDYYEYQDFSRNFPSIVHLGGSIVYIMLQFAFYLGSKEVVLLGLDHSYANLCEMYGPGKIQITSENVEEVRKCHFDTDYYKVGQVLGVPDTKKQDKAFETANHIFLNAKRKVQNVGEHSKCTVFEKVSLPEWYVKIK